jgi:hypothetical protein
MRDGFRELAEGWLMVDDFNVLTERIERLADWVMVHGGPLEMTPQERRTVIMMIERQMVLACRQFGLGVPSL